MQSFFVDPFRALITLVFIFTAFLSISVGIMGAIEDFKMKRAEKRANKD